MKHTYNIDKISELESNGKSLAQIAKIIQIPRETLAQWLKRNCIKTVRYEKK